MNAINRQAGGGEAMAARLPTLRAASEAVSLGTAAAGGMVLAAMAMREADAAEARAARAGAAENEAREAAEGEAGRAAARDVAARDGAEEAAFSANVPPADRPGGANVQSAAERGAADQDRIDAALAAHEAARSGAAPESEPEAANAPETGEGQGAGPVDAAFVSPADAAGRGDAAGSGMPSATGAAPPGETEASLRDRLDDIASPDLGGVATGLDLTMPSLASDIDDVLENVPRASDVIDEVGAITDNAVSGLAADTLGAPADAVFQEVWSGLADDGALFPSSAAGPVGMAETMADDILGETASLASSVLDGAPLAGSGAGGGTPPSAEDDAAPAASGLSGLAGLASLPVSLLGGTEDDEAAIWGESADPDAAVPDRAALDQGIADRAIGDQATGSGPGTDVAMPALGGDGGGLQLDFLGQSYLDVADAQDVGAGSMSSGLHGLI